MTVDEWYHYWLDTQLTGLSPNTKRNCQERYEKNDGLIAKHPMDGVRFDSPMKVPDAIHFLTVPEQKAFLAAAKQSVNYYQYALILETGLRTGEMIALAWDDVDWEQHKFTIRKTMEFRYEQQDWRAGPPKTKRSYRTFP